jgi:Xaa-Pro aminopeptidase
VLLVTDVKTEHNFGDRGYLGFEHVTLVPMQQKLIAKEMLSEEEKKWIDAYHEKCWEKVGSIMADSDGKAWLYRETRPLFSTQ